MLAPPSRHLSGGISRWLQPLERPLPADHLVLREILDLRDELCGEGAELVAERS